MSNLNTHRFFRSSARKILSRNKNPVLLSIFLCSTAAAGDWSIVYTGESASNLHGGIAQDHAYLGNLDIITEWQSLNWLAPGGTLFLYVLGNHGESPSEFIGDAQTFSNIDSPKAIKLYEAWYQQPLFQNAGSLKIGLMDLNSEFDVIESAGVFQNSSFGIGPDFSQSGANGPSIFPTTSLGIRLAKEFSNNFYGQCIVLDAVPGNPENPRGTHIKINSKEGYLAGCEAGLNHSPQEESDPIGKLSLGAWQYSEPVETIDADKKERSNGMYLLAEKNVWQAGNRTAHVFGRVGFANAEVHQYGRYTGAGIVLNGIAIANGSDQLGLGIASVENGDNLDQRGHSNENLRFAVV
jgi:porin